MHFGLRHLCLQTHPGFPPGTWCIGTQMHFQHNCTANGCSGTGVSQHVVRTNPPLRLPLLLSAKLNYTLWTTQVKEWGEWISQQEQNKWYSGHTILCPQSIKVVLFFVFFPSAATVILHIWLYHTLLLTENITYKWWNVTAWMSTEHFVQ